MKRFERLKYFVLGFIVMGLMTTMMVPALAEPTTKQISAAFSNIKIYVDDQLIQPKDAQGNIIEPFIYNGTTYLPVRPLAEALGKAVTWEGKTGSVYIGKHDSDTPAVMLSQLDYFTQNTPWHVEEFPKDNLGNTYTEGLTNYHGYTSGGKREYVLDGKYRRMKGKFILNYSDRSSSGEYFLKIYGDEKLLYSFSEMTAGVRPAEFDVDLTGVLQLRIEMYAGSWGYTTIADVGLYQ